MENKITLNESVKEAIEIALVKIMRKKDINKIKITEICEIAGVGRSSFYRNFDSFEDVAVSYLNRIYAEYFRQNPVASDTYQKAKFSLFLKERFRFVKKNGDFFEALNKSGMLYGVMRKMDSKIKNQFLVADISESKYFNAMIIGFSAGVIEEWVAGGMKESEEEIAKIVKACLLGTVKSLKDAF